MPRTEWCLLALSACGGAEAAEQSVDRNSSTVADAGPPDAGAARDAETPRTDARVGLAAAPEPHDHGEGIALPPEPPAPAHDACDPLRQTGCSAETQCDLTEHGFSCVPAGPLTAFQRCDGPDTPGLCRRGTLCVATAYGDSRCATYCDLQTGSGCAGSLDVCTPIPGAGERIGACASSHQCNPVAQDCDGAGETCVWAAFGAYCVAQNGFVQTGSACDSGASCEPGSACVDDGSGATRCFQQCDPSEPTCTSDEQCVPFAQIGESALGACRLTAALAPVEI